jgi:hypothetical protein
MKTEFKLDSHLADLTGSKIKIVGKNDRITSPYVRIELPEKLLKHTRNTCMFIYDKDLERFAVNILKALKSKRLKAS